MQSVDKTRDKRQWVILTALWGSWYTAIPAVKLTFIKFLIPASHWCEHCARLMLSFHTIPRRRQGLGSESPTGSHGSMRRNSALGTQAAEWSLLPFYMGMEATFQPVNPPDLGPAMEPGIELSCTQLFFLLLHVIILVTVRTAEAWISCSTIMGLLRQDNHNVNVLPMWTL